MNARHFAKLLIPLATLLSCTAFASGGPYCLTVVGERLEFVPQPEKGYVVKLRVETQNFASLRGGIQALAGVSALDAEDAMPVGGLDRQGVWTVENEGPAGHNEGVIRALRAGGRACVPVPGPQKSGRYPVLPIDISAYTLYTAHKRSGETWGH